MKKYRMSQMYLRELRCCGLYMVMVNNQPTDCCGLAFAGSPGPLETHLVCITPTCRACNGSKRGRGQRAPSEESQSWLTLGGWEVDKLGVGWGGDGLY